MTTLIIWDPTKYNPTEFYSGYDSERLYKSGGQWTSNIDFWVINHNIPKEKFPCFEAQGISWVKETDLMAVLQDYPLALEWYLECIQFWNYCYNPTGWHIRAYLASCLNYLKDRNDLLIPNLKTKSGAKFLEHIKTPPSEEVFEAIAILYRRLFFSDYAKELNTLGCKYYPKCFHIYAKPLISSIKEVIEELKTGLNSELILRPLGNKPEAIHKILFEPQEPNLDYWEYPLRHKNPSLNDRIHIVYDQNKETEEAALKRFSLNYKEWPNTNCIIDAGGKPIKFV